MKWPLQFPPWPAAGGNPNQVAQSASDKSHYQHIVLQNGMRVLLMLSDKNIDPKFDFLCGLSISVDVGACSQTARTIGLPHLLEHLISNTRTSYNNQTFLEYGPIVGGMANAETTLDSTSYFCEVPSHQIDSAMEVASEMLWKPDLGMQNIRNELTAIDQEFWLRNCNDAQRLVNLLLQLCSDERGNTHYVCGNKETLTRPGVDLQKEVQKLFSQYYVGSNITLAVWSHRPLQATEEAVRRLFGRIPKSAQSASRSRFQRPFSRKQCTSLSQRVMNRFARLIFAVPTTRKDTIFFSWTVPKNAKDYTRKTFECFIHVVGNYNKNGLFDTLYSKGLARKLEVTCKRKMHTDFVVVVIKVELTQAGLDEYLLVARHVHQFLNKVRLENPLPVAWKDLRLCRSIAFTFNKPNLPSTYLLNISLALLTHPIVHVLSSSYYYGNSDEHDFTSKMMALTPDKCCTVLMSQAFQEDPSSFTSVESFTGLRWKYVDFPADWLQKTQLDYSLISQFEFAGVSPLLWRSFSRLTIYYGSSPVRPFPNEFPRAYLFDDTEHFDTSMYFHYVLVNQLPDTPTWYRFAHAVTKSLIDMRMEIRYMYHCTVYKRCVFGGHNLIRCDPADLSFYLSGTFSSLCDRCLPHEVEAAKQLLRDDIYKMVHQNSTYAEYVLDRVNHGETSYHEKLEALDSVTVKEVDEIREVYLRGDYYTFADGPIQLDQLKDALENMERLQQFWVPPDPAEEEQEEEGPFEGEVGDQAEPGEAEVPYEEAEVPYAEADEGQMLQHAEVEEEPGNRKRGQSPSRPQSPKDERRPAEERQSTPLSTPVVKKRRSQEGDSLGSGTTGPESAVFDLSNVASTSRGEVSRPYGEYSSEQVEDRSSPASPKKRRSFEVDSSGVNVTEEGSTEAGAGVEGGTSPGRSSGRRSPCSPPAVKRRRSDDAQQEEEQYQVEEGEQQFEVEEQQYEAEQPGYDLEPEPYPPVDFEPEPPTPERTCIRVLSKNPAESCSHIVNYYTLGSESDSITMACYKGLRWFARRFFLNYLRGEHGHGYDPAVNTSKINEAPCLSVHISPPAHTHTLTSADEAIDSFIAFLREQLNYFDMNMFYEMKKSFQHLAQESIADSASKRRVRFFSSIATGAKPVYHEPTGRAWRGMQALDYETFMDCAMRALSPQCYAKISVQVVGFGEVALKECQGGEELYEEFLANPTMQTRLRDDEDITFMFPLVEKPGVNYVETVEFYDYDDE